MELSMHPLSVLLVCTVVTEIIGAKEPHDDCFHHCQHGTCIIDTTAVPHGHDPIPYICKCELGWGGAHCDHDERDRICGSRICRHGHCALGAFLIGRAIDDPICICQVGFQGDECDQPDPRMPCADANCLHGFCLTPLQPHAHPTCVCYPGWEGRDCDVTGQLCGHEHCLHGQCVGGNPPCQCESHWSGHKCDIPGTMCLSGPCYYGTCVFGHCQCDANWNGTMCNKYIPPPTTTATTTIATTTTTATTTATTTTTVATTTQPISYNDCDRVQMVSLLSNHVVSTDQQAAKCPSGSQSSPSALVLSLCKVGGLQSWTPGTKVMDDCANIPAFTPIASFPANSGYVPDGGWCGVFLGCLPDGFKMAAQLCDGPANITHIVNGGVFNHDPNVYYTIQ